MQCLGFCRTAAGSAQSHQRLEMCVGSDFRPSARSCNCKGPSCKTTQRRLLRTLHLMKGYIQSTGSARGMSPHKQLWGWQKNTHVETKCCGPRACLSPRCEDPPATKRSFPLYASRRVFVPKARTHTKSRYLPQSCATCALYGRYFHVRGQTCHNCKNAGRWGSGLLNVVSVGSSYLYVKPLAMQLAPQEVDHKELFLWGEHSIFGLFSAGFFGILGGILACAVLCAILRDSEGGHSREIRDSRQDSAG